MSSKLFMLASGATGSSLTSSDSKIATGTSLKCLLQIQPTMGIEIVEWGISFDGSAAATPGQVDLVEVDVAASGGTAAVLPVSYLSSSLSATTVTSVSLQAALQGSSSTYQVGMVNFGGLYSGAEQMQVTAGGSTTNLSVIRAANDSAATSTVAVSTLLYALPGTGVYSDIQPYGAMPNADPTYCLSATPGTAATGFGFTTYNSPTRIRQGDFQLLPPTAPYVKQFPLERGFEVMPGRFGQIRCTFGTTVNAWCYVIFQA